MLAFNNRCSGAMKSWVFASCAGLSNGIVVQYTSEILLQQGFVLADGKKRSKNPCCLRYGLEDADLSPMMSLHKTPQHTADLKPQIMCQVHHHHNEVATIDNWLQAALNYEFSQ